MRAARTSTLPPRRTATRRSGAWTRRPSPRWPPTRRDTACRPRGPSGSTSRPSGCSGLRSMSALRVPRVLAALTEAAQARPDEDAVFEADRVLTWRGLAGRAGGVTRRLTADGIRPGDRVAITMPNGWRFAVALLGALGTGGTGTPLNPALSPGGGAAAHRGARP